MNNSVKLNFLEKGNLFLNQLYKKNTDISILKNLSIEYIKQTLNNLNELNNKYIIDTIKPYFIDGKLQLINPANYFLNSYDNLSQNYDILSIEDILNIYKMYNKNLYLNIDFPIELNDVPYERIPIIKSNNNNIYQIKVNNCSIVFEKIDYEYEIKPVVINVRNTLYQLLINDDDEPKLYCDICDSLYDYNEIYINDGNSCFTFDINEVYSLGVLNKYDNIYYRLDIDSNNNITLATENDKYKKINVKDTLTCFDNNGCYKVYIDTNLQNGSDVKFIFEELDYSNIKENYIIKNNKLYRVIKDNDNLCVTEANDILLISYKVSNEILYERDIICLKKIEQIDKWKKIDIIIEFILSLLKDKNYNWIKNWTIGCNLDKKINNNKINIPVFKDIKTGKYYKLDIQNSNYVLNKINIYNNDIIDYYIKGNNSIYKLYVENGQLFCNETDNNFISNINIPYNNEFYDLIYDNDIILNKKNDELQDFCNPILYVWLMYTLNQKVLNDSELFNLSINWGFPNVSKSLENFNLSNLNNGNNTIDKYGRLEKCIQDNWILNVITTLNKSSDIDFNGFTGKQNDSINFGISTIISFYMFDNIKSLEKTCENINNLAEYISKLCIKDIEEYEKFIIDYNNIEVSKNSYTDEVYFNNIYNLYICEKNKVNYTITNINDEEYNTGLYYYDINDCELYNKKTINKIKFIYDYLKNANYVQLDNIGEKSSSSLANYGKVSYKQLTFSKDNYNIYLITGYINDENISSEIFVNLYADYFKTYLLYNRQEYMLVDDEIINIPKNNFLIVYEEINTIENIDEIEYQIDYKIDNYKTILKSLIKLLSSTYNKELTDLNYYKLLRSMALEYANIKYEKISLLKNANVNDVYNDYIYSNFGSLVNLKQRIDYSNIKYKKLIKGVIKALLQGSTIQVIEEVLKLFFNFDIKLFELYKDEDYEYIQKYNGKMSYTYEQRLYTFWIEITKDLEKYTEQVDIIEEFRYIINIIKPAHTLAMLMLKMSGEENYRNSYLNKYNTFFTNADKVLVDIDWPFSDNYMYDFTNSYLFENKYEKADTPYRNILGMFGHIDNEQCNDELCDDDNHKNYNVFMNKRVKDVYTLADIKINYNDDYLNLNKDDLYIHINIGSDDNELIEKYNGIEKCNDNYKFDSKFTYSYLEQYRTEEHNINDDFSMIMHTPNSIIKINKVITNGNLELAKYEVANIVEEAINIKSINISGNNIENELIDIDAGEIIQNSKIGEAIYINNIDISGSIVKNVNENEDINIDINTDGK